MNDIESQVLAANLRTAQDFVNRGLTPDDTTPPWLRTAVDEIKSGKTLTADDIDDFQKMGGTGHPDPTLHSSPTMQTRDIK